MDAENTLKWTLDIQEDPETGDAILEFPPDVLAKTGWQEGDTLVWKELGDGAWTLSRADPNEKSN